MDPIDAQQPQPAEPAVDEEIVGTLGLKITLRATREGAELPTLDGVRTSLAGWDLSEYGLRAVVTHAEWT